MMRKSFIITLQYFTCNLVTREGNTCNNNTQEMVDSNLQIGRSLFGYQEGFPKLPTVHVLAKAIKGGREIMNWLEKGRVLRDKGRLRRR